MKEKLTIEQSNRLIELGVDPSKASEIEEIDVTPRPKSKKPMPL